MKPKKKPSRKPQPRLKRPRLMLLDRGNESMTYSVGRGFVQKEFKPYWIGANYAFGEKLQPNFRLWRKGMFSKVFSPKQWEKITLLLANHSCDVFRTAKKLGISTPKFFKPVFVEREKGGYWVLEMSDLRRKGTELVNAESLEKYSGGIMGVKNLQELKELISENEKKLMERGISLDRKHGSPGWIVRINKRTGIGKLFLLDATNYKAFYPQEKKKPK